MKLIDDIKACFSDHIDWNSAKHFGVCFALSVLAGWYGLCTALGAAFTKEWCDKNNGGHWCWADLGFDLAGMIVGIGINLLLL